jgi:hypothetical protein
MKLPIVIGMFSLVMIGCARQSELTGDVFIVTRGAGNYKLGLVTVSAIPAEAVEAHLKAKQHKGNAERARLQPQLQKAQAAFAEASKEQDRLYNAYLADILNPKKEAAWKAAQERTAATGLWSLERQLASYDRADFLFDGLPNGVTTAKTDSEGKFKLILPRGRYALAARGERYANDRTENYDWLVWVSLERPSVSVMLSNDNKMGSGSADSALELKEGKLVNIQTAAR